ncbi:trehalase-like isoform X2 [Marmota monax]|uniref:trehalase-like isoform X2 n=1 Tax=Marmota monax TaxID=9995 RepID=UPI0026EF1EF1|nr:trehalase-like isoform X2 [Marmota monax]
MPPPGNDSQAERYRNLRAQRLAALNALLWDEQKGAWFDYDTEKGKNLEFYPSNLAPLWAGCFSDPATVDKALKYLEDSQVLTYQHGIPTSLRNTGQQWDFPNAWAPLQDLVIRETELPFFPTLGWVICPLRTHPPQERSNPDFGDGTRRPQKWLFPKLTREFPTPTESM